MFQTRILEKKLDENLENRMITTNEIRESIKKLDEKVDRDVGEIKNQLGELMKMMANFTDDTGKVIFKND